MAALAWSWRIGVGCMVAAATLSLYSAACSSDDQAQPKSDGGADGTAGLTPEQMFRALQPELIARCGGTNGVCHVNGSLNAAPVWLGNPDPYVSAKNYRGVLPASGDPHDSIILTQVEHTGPSLQSTPPLFGKVQEWVGAELNAMTAKLPAAGPFAVVDGPNTIDLGKVLPGVTDGAKLTFNGSSQNNVLSMTNIRITAGPGSAMKMDSPFFVVVPEKGKVIADPNVNGFAGELVVAANESKDFYSGSMIILPFPLKTQLKLVFKKLEKPAGIDAGPSGECTALDVFQSQALPQFQASIPLVEGGTSSCVFCHGGGNETAVNAMDLTALGSDPKVACAQARNWINFSDKSKSVIILNPTGAANPNHPVQALPANGPIVMGIKAWVDAEK